MGTVKVHKVVAVGQKAVPASQPLLIPRVPVFASAVYMESIGTVNRTVLLAPLLTWLLDSSRVTALIAPNDSAAQWLYVALSAMGLAVPRDVSLISFDNYPGALSTLITTVDFGFGYLGYAALHALIGDLPGLGRPGRSIPSRAQVMDRGSVGRVKCRS